MEEAGGEGGRESVRSRRRVADVLSLSEEPVEVSSHDQRDRAAQRGVSTAGEDASQLAQCQVAELLLFGLLVSGQIRVRRIDGWEQLNQIPQPLTEEAA